MRCRKRTRPAAEMANGPREGDLLGPPITSMRTPKSPETQVIRAELIRSECRALGLAARGHAPIFAICRSLIAAGYDPSTKLEAWRGDVLAISLSIGAGSDLTVEDDRHGRPRLRRWRNREQRYGAASPIRRQELLALPPRVSKADAHGCRPSSPPPRDNSFPA